MLCLKIGRDRDDTVLSGRLFQYLMTQNEKKFRRHGYLGVVFLVMCRLCLRRLYPPKVLNSKQSEQSISTILFMILYSITRSFFIRRVSKLSRLSLQSLSLQLLKLMFARWHTLRVNVLCTLSIALMSSPRCGDQVQVLYSSIGRTYILYRLTSSW